MGQIFLDGVKGTGKQVPQIMGKDFAGIYLRFRTQLFHIVTDVGAVQGLSAFCPEDVPASDVFLPGIL